MTNAQQIKNWLTSVFGAVAGVPQIAEGLFSSPRDWSKVALGIGLLVVGQFTANKKPGVSEAPKPAGDGA